MEDKRMAELRLIQAALAEVARVTADVDRMADMLRVCECGHHAVAHEGRRFFCNMKGCDCAALRGDTAPEQPAALCECGHYHGDHSESDDGGRRVCMHLGCNCIVDTAPAAGRE